MMQIRIALVVLALTLAPAVAIADCVHGVREYEKITATPCGAGQILDAATQSCAIAATS